MAETMDLNDFDLDSFITSCDPEDSPSSPEELVNTLDSLESLPDPVIDAATPLTRPLPFLSGSLSLSSRTLHFPSSANCLSVLRAPLFSLSLFLSVCLSVSPLLEPGGIHFHEKKCPEKVIGQGLSRP